MRICEIQTDSAPPFLLVDHHLLIFCFSRSSSTAFLNILIFLRSAPLPAQNDNTVERHLQIQSTNELCEGRKHLSLQFVFLYTFFVIGLIMVLVVTINEVVALFNTLIGDIHFNMQNDTLTMEKVTSKARTITGPPLGSASRLPFSIGTPSR